VSQLPIDRLHNILIPIIKSARVSLRVD